MNELIKVLEHINTSLPEMIVRQMEFKKGLLSVWATWADEIYHISKWMPDGNLDACIVSSLGSYSGKWSSQITGRLRK